jgi:hypothetical protein
MDTNEGFDYDAAVESIGADLGFDDSSVDSTSSETDDIDFDVDGEKASIAANVQENKAPAEAASPTATAATTPTAVTSGAAAPRTWRAEAAAEWEKLPPTVQAEVMKREEDMFRGIESYKQDAHFGKSFQQVLAPYTQIMQQHNIDPLQQVSGLLQAHMTLATGSPEQKIALFEQLAADYGVDLTAAAGEAPYIDPAVKSLREQLASVQSIQQEWQRQQATAKQNEMMQTVAAFAQKPENVYFNELADDIAVLLKSGVSKNLQEAYDKALWANPVTRSKELARVEATKKTEADAAAKQKALKARSAMAANVRSSAKNASAAAPLGSMDDTLNEVYASIISR